MAIDQNVSVKTADHTSSVIENELSAYRAISTAAVFSLIFGVLSVLSFASLYFLAFSVLAMFLGFKAEKTIKKFPDMFTGRKISQTGFGLGLIFGLTALTIVNVQSALRANAAKAFAREMESTFQKGTLDQLIWTMQAPGVRGTLTPEEVMEKMRGKGGPAPQMFDVQYASVKAIKDALASPGSEIHFASIEKHGDFDLTMYAAALFELHDPQSKNAEEKERFALATMKAVRNSKGKYEWWVDDIKFPYQRNTFVPPTPKPVDDGHGHGEGDGHGH